MRRMLAVLALAALGGCNDGTAPVNDLTEARARWEKWGYTSYDLTVTRTCFCGEVEPIRSIVRDGVLISQVYASSGEPVPSPRTYATVEGLFEAIETAMANEAEELVVQYSELTGLPERITIDFRASTADDEFFYTASIVAK